MCGQTWAGAALAFVGMWGLMMAAMMLPSLAPSLWRYRSVVGKASHAWRLTACVATGYVFVWTLLGLALFGVGACVAALALQWPAFARAMPVLAGAIVLMAGAWQFTAWKARLLVCCMTCPVATAAPVMRVAWRHGLRLGMFCIGRCAGAIACMVAGGVMDPAVMAIATIAISAERLAPAKSRVVAWIGAACMVAGASMVARQIGDAADVALYIPIVHSVFQEDAFPCDPYDAHPYELAGWEHGDGIQQPQADA